jgi:hypothetical protein
MELKLQLLIGRPVARATSPHPGGNKELRLWVRLCLTLSIKAPRRAAGNDGPGYLVLLSHRRAHQKRARWDARGAELHPPCFRIVRADVGFMRLRIDAMLDRHSQVARLQQR